ncbi:crooked legs [Carabus blaptoides fortunei]
MPNNMKCCVPDCISHKVKSKLAFHRLPTNKLLAEKWLQTFANAKMKVHKNSRICSRHFKTHQYKDLRKSILKKGVIPMLFMPKPTPNVVQTNLEKSVPNNSLEDTTLEENATNLNENSTKSSSIPIKLYDFNKTCRICLLEKEDLQNMDSDFIQKLFQSSDILKFSANDALPKQICAVCLGELKVVHSFSLKCGKSSDVFRTSADKFTNAEQIMDSGVDRMRLSKTVEVSYVPSEAEMLNNEDKQRTHNYKLVAGDNIQKTVSSLISLDRLKETRAIAEKPPLTTAVQAFEIPSSELTKQTTNSLENANCLSLDYNSSNPSDSLANKYTFDTNIVRGNKDFMECKVVKENSTNLSNKRVLRKRKSMVTATGAGKEAVLSSKTQTLVPTVQNIIRNQDASTAVVDLTEERVVHHSRSVKRHARKVASGIGQYWYDKPRDSSVNQMNTDVSKASENGNEGLEKMDTSARNELLGFDQKGTRIVGELNVTRDENSTSIDTSTNSTERNSGSEERIAVLAASSDLAERNVVSVERTARPVERITGLAETTGLAERNVGVVETNGLAERNVGVAETTGLAERNVGVVERTAGSVEITAQTDVNAHSVMNKTQVEQNSTTILKCQPTNISIHEEKTTNVVNIPKRGRGRPRKRPVVPTVKLETVCFDNKNDTATQLDCEIAKWKSENDIIGNVVTKNEKYSIKNDITGNVITKNEKYSIKNDITGNVITKNEKYKSENNIIGNVITKNEKCSIENDNTNNLMPQNEKCITENTSTSKPGNRVKSAKRNTKIGTAVTNITENTNSTLTEKQSCLPVSKTDTIIGNTAEHLPTVEPVISIKDCQHHSNKITKQTNTSINVVENEVIYMKLRHKNVKYSPGSRKRKLPHRNVNIKHLHISKNEFNKMLNVKLELNQFKVKCNKEKFSINKSISKKKVRLFNSTTNNRVLRSSKRKIHDNEHSALIKCNVENIKLAKDSVLQNVEKLHLNGDQNTEINIKTAAKVSESEKITLNVNSYENDTPKQIMGLENAGRVNKMEDNCSTNTTFKDETGLNNKTDEEMSETELDNAFGQISADVKNATEPCENINMELDKCSPDTTSKCDTQWLESKTDLASSEVEHECLLNNSTESTKYSIASKPEIDSQNTVIEHAYSLSENTEDALNYKIECLPDATEQDYLANDVEKTPLNKVIDNNTDNETKSQLIELLHEFVVFDQNRSTSTADENTVTGLATEEYSTKNYYQLLDGTHNSLTDDAQVINSDAMLCNVMKLSPELKPGVPIMYEHELNDSFEISINNILNTEYNTVCDGHLVGSGIVLEDVAVNEEVLPTQEPKPVLYQHVDEQSPQFRVNCDNVYFNKRSGMIVTSLPLEETSNYSSEDEYYSSKFHNTWVPIVQPVPTESLTLESAPSTSDTNIVIKHSASTVDQNFPHQCKVCKVAFNTKEQLNCHTVYAGHVTKRFCKYCKVFLDIAEFDTHIKRHENDLYCCEYCGEMVYEFDKFLRHRRIHRRHKCQLCPMEFETKFLMSQHLTIHIGVRRDQCKYCHRTFGSTSALIKHLASRTCLKKKETFICTVCKKIFNSKEKTMQHVTQHQKFECEDYVFEMLACCTLVMVSVKDELPDKICLQCLNELKVSYKFYQKCEVSDIRLHIVLEKSKQTHRVANSPSMSSKMQLEIMQTAMKNNLEISTIEKDASVSLESDNAYKNIHNDHDYIITENIYEKENSTPDESVLNCNQINTDTDQTTNSSKTSNSSTYECTKCSKTGFTYRQLRIHWMTVHGVKCAERKCEVCKKLIGVKEFKQHIQSHPQYKAFACDVCDAKFKSEANLLSHKVSHLSVKPYLCDKCDTQFSRLGSLQKHIKKQSCPKVLPPKKISRTPDGYQCRVCNRCYPSKAGLYQHALIHGNKKYLCWYCGKSFTTCGSLLSHTMPSTYFKCIVPGCGNNTKINPQQAFFHLPKPMNILENWAKNMNLLDVLLKRQSSRRHYKICRMHFEDSCFQTFEKKKLNRGAVPTIFNFERDPILEDGTSPCQEDIPVRLDEISPTMQAVPGLSKNRVISGHAQTAFGDEMGTIPLRTPATLTLTMNTDNHKISVIDFNKICRICMSEGDLVNIFSHCEGEDCVFEMLACCTLIMVSIKDELPDKICLQCLDELKVAYKFYQKSEVSDTRLQKLLEKSKQANQVKSSPSQSSKSQLERMQTALKNKLEISTIENDASVSLESRTAFENNIHNDHDYITTENIIEKENSTSDESVLNCNQINTDPTTNSCKTSNSRSGECTKCFKTGFTYGELRIHWMKVHGAKYAELECVVCNKFIRFKEYKQHIRTHPEYRPYACDLCDAKFQFKNNLDRHQVSHFKQHSCDKCDKRFSRLESLRVHIEKQRCTSNLPPPEGYLCRVCNRWCPTKASLYQHSLIHGEKKYLCWYCGKGFTSHAGLITHRMQVTQIKNEDKDKDQISLPKDTRIAIKHESDSDYEDFDSSSVNSETDLELRLQKEKNKLINVDKSDLKQLKYECKMCNSVFSTKKELIVHRKITKHINKRLYSCTICSKNVAAGNVKTHMKLHTNKKLHSCYQCGRKFYSTYNLKRHMLTHTGERPFQCELCNKSFTRFTYLTDHRKLHCDETYSCSFCSKTFSEDAKLHLHLKMHDTADNKCDICDALFDNVDLLLQHLKLHEADGTLVCKVCGKRFIRIRQFKIHMKKHSDKTGETYADKSYTHVCKYCQRGFQSKASLNNHLLTHGEKSFLCSDCGKGFVSSSQLQTHMRSHTVA